MILQLSKYSIFSLIIILILFAAGCSRQKKNDENSQYPLLPNFSYRSASGNEYSQKPLYEGVGVISFVATWCAPCRIEFIELDSLAKKHAGLLTYAVTYEPPEFYITLLESLKINVPIIKVDSAFFVSLGIQKLPTRLLIDHGKVVSQLVGAPSPPDSLFNALLQNALGIKPDTTTASK